MLQVEWAQRDVLRRDVQPSVVGKHLGAASKGLLGGDLGEIGGIVLLGQMREDEMARAPVKNVGIGEKIAHHRIRQVAGAAHHALFDVPGIRPHLQHFEIVVRFEHQEIRIAQVMLDQFRHVAEVCDDGHLCAIRVERVANRLDRVVRDGKRVNLHIPDLESRPWPDEFDPLELRFWTIRINLQEFEIGWLREIGRALPIARELRETVAMIGMLVRDQDGVDVLGTAAAEGFESAKHFAAAKASVNQESGVFGFEQRAVARAAGSEDGDPERDASALGGVEAITGVD